MQINFDKKEKNTLIEITEFLKTLGKKDLEELNCFLKGFKFAKTKSEEK